MEPITKLINLTLPIFSNLRLQIKYQCGDITPFANIKSFKVASAGRNVDGFMSDILNGRIEANYSNQDPTMFINNTVEMDLAVITNTGYTFRDKQNISSDFSIIVFSQKSSRFRL